MELTDPHAFSRLGTAFAVRSAIAQGLIRVVKGAQNSRQTLEVLEAHFGDAILSIKVYLKRSLFKLQQDKLQSCLDVTSQILVIADRLSHMDFELSPLDVIILLLFHTEDRCFKKAKDLKLQEKKSAQNSPRKEKSASAFVARASGVTSDYESAEEEF